MGWFTRLLLAIVLMGVLALLWRRFYRTQLSGRPKAAWTLLGAGFLLMVPTSTVLTLSRPSAAGVVLGLFVAIIIGVLLFLLLGPLGVAGAFGAKAFGIWAYMIVLGAGGMIGSLTGGLIRYAPRGLVSPWVWGALIAVGLILLLATPRSKPDAKPPDLLE